MKKIYFLLLFILPLLSTQAQINAITETGEEVVLYDDGTWTYVNDKDLEKTEIPLNENPFFKAAKASFLVKSKRLDIGIWINPKKWSFNKASSNEDAEFEFQNRDGDLYAMLIAERMEIPLPTLRDIAFENAKSAAPDVKIVKEEYRMVNGVKVLMMQMQGTIRGIKFMYLGYYYSYEGGTVQFISYTSSAIFEDKHDELEDFLNGFVRLNEE